MPGHDDGLPQMAFVDGVRRIDARLTVDDPQEGPVSGVCGSFAVGATIWDREDRSSRVVGARVERVAGAVRASARRWCRRWDSIRPYRTETSTTRDPLTRW